MFSDYKNDEKMFLEFIDLFDNYTKKDKFADMKYVNQFYVIVRKFYDISKQLEDIIETKKNTAYNPYGKILRVNLPFEFKYLNSVKDLCSDKDFKCLYNMDMLETLMHELEHMFQQELIEGNNDSIEKRILALGDHNQYYSKDKYEGNFKLLQPIKILYHLLWFRKYYNNNHDLAPEERIANLRSYDKMYYILNMLNEHNKGLTLYESHLDIDFNKKLFLGYSVVDIFLNGYTNSPSLDFLKNMKYTNNEEKIIEDLSLNDMNIPYMDRVLYGLSLTRDEYVNMRTLKR